MGGGSGTNLGVASVQIKVFNLSVFFLKPCRG